MVNREASMINGIHFENPRHEAHQDIHIDMQYAQHGCTRDEFAAEPWTHCKDHTSTYLSMRFDKRSDFITKLSEEKLRRVKHEEKRIDQTRVNFTSYERKKAMMEKLKAAKQGWRNEVMNKQEEYVAKIRKDSSKFRNQKLDLELLERVKLWKIADNEEESGLQPKTDLEYGFKACAIYFQKNGSGFEEYTHDNPKFLPSVFPNQKMSVHNILEDEPGNPLGETCPSNRLRYFHFPSNNMRWIEKAMARYYGEKDGDHHNDSKPTKEMSKAEKLLSREFWRGQLHGGSGGNGPVHARYMRSRCSIVPEDVGSGAYEQPVVDPRSSSISVSQKNKKKNFALFRYPKAKKADEKAKESFFDIWQATAKEKKREKMPQKSKLGEYLFALAMVADAMDYEADERLLRDNLHQNPPLHIRRTLDQSYFLTLDDTGIRDKDQVVYRGTRLGNSFHSHSTRVVMVDQLWLWILDDNTILTSFPRRWGRNKPDPSGVHKSLRDRLKHLPEGQIQSVYDLALIIIDQCSRVFFDRTKPLDQRPEVMDLFASAIGNVAEQTTIAYESFWRNLEIRSKNPIPYGSNEHVSHKYLDINPEGTILRESHDIAEELQIMIRIYNQQLHVVRDLRKILGHINGESKNETDEMRSIMKFLKYKENPGAKEGETNSYGEPDIVPEHTIQEANDTLELLRNRLSEIQELEDAAVRTSQQLQGLLSLKQQQASIIEAKAALRRADESVKQGRAIMAFTLVTIFFLPLGFLATFFGMNNKDINDAPWMTLNQQLKYMFGLSTAVIVFAVSTAFSPWTRATLTIFVKVPLAFIAEYTGLRAAWNEYIVGHSALEKRGQMKLDRIYGRQKRKESKMNDEEEKGKTEAQWGIRTGVSEGARQRTASQLGFDLRNGGKLKDLQDTSIEEMV
ncbi:hypothetical protein ONS95_004322 [Cadophora gregata]|uniref:uncharacterized protein n=1 Tax=Cadophora gregata TaxID=51156 RepID=UPI0026DAEAFA|nr:uncharacterized protein ONS95_004322 [Cadophora gregata]KAK0105805.1 hypothetical protein ONS95_004322 [Cadophora gregata]